jgi:hypothetical protein
MGSAWRASPTDSGWLTRVNAGRYEAIMFAIRALPGLYYRPLS